MGLQLGCQVRLLQQSDADVPRLDGRSALSDFPGKRTMDDPDNDDRLDFRRFPATLAVPAPGQWLEITGQFDHPSSTTCEEFERLECRSTFTATQVVALGP